MHARQEKRITDLARAKLPEFGELGSDHAHETAGLVVGAFSGLSPGCYELVNPIARARALKQLPFVECRSKGVLTIFLCLWGLVAYRGWTRLMRDCHSGLVIGSPASEYHGSVDPIGDTNTHRNFFNPDHGLGGGDSSSVGQGRAHLVFIIRRMGGEPSKLIANGGGCLLFSLVL